MRALDFTLKMKHHETAYIVDMFIQLSVTSRFISCGHPPLKKDCDHILAAQFCLAKLVGMVG